MALEQLIKLPLRVGVRAANLTLRVTGEAAGRAFTVAGQVVRVVRPEDEPAPQPEHKPAPRPEPERAPPALANGAAATAEPPRARAPQAARPATPEPPPAPGPPPAPEPPPSPMRAPLPRLDQEPDHVSEEPVLVEEFADPGAEDGAGAEVTVDEPWAGYRQLTAQEVIEGLVALSAEQLAAVQLYEGTHRRRDTVLTAVDHQLRLAS